jgi:cysteinyl-tRNA synthetase
MVGSHFDMYVLEPVRSEKWEENFNISGLINEIREYNTIHYRKVPIILAYIDIGQAEDWRWYWEDNWKIGDPDWIIGDDPDGWEGCYPVAFWDTTWQNIVIYGYEGKSFVEMTLEDGFDGIYMDWVEAFCDSLVVVKAQMDGVDPVNEMFDFIEKICTYARQESPNANPEYLIIAQNAPDLYEEDPVRYIQCIDAISQEGVWYTGGADADWFDPLGYNVRSCDLYPEWSQYVLETLMKIRNHMPVFCAEYAQDLGGFPFASDVYNSKAPQFNFIPYCTRTSLSQLSRTPYPKDYFPRDY